ncbi:MAG TPA: type 4a pilus biogenesis protein PilO [Candidatus Paceibacterota bacterium]
MKFLFPFIFIAAAIAGFVLFTNPQYQKMQEKRAEQQEVVDANKKANALRAERERLLSDRNKIKEADIDRLNKMLPDSVENVGLIIDIDNIASKYGMRIRNTKITELTARTGTTAVGPDSKKHGSIALTFSVTSAYDTFLAFMKDLEASLRLVDVTALSFSATRDGRYDFTLTLQTYWLK